MDRLFLRPQITVLKSKDEGDVAPPYMLYNISRKTPYYAGGCVLHGLKIKI